MPIIMWFAPEEGDLLDIVGWVTMDNESGENL